MRTAKGGRSERKPTTKEKLKPVDDRTVGKRKAATKPEKSNKKVAKDPNKPAKDPNKPKRPASAFFVFLEDFRKTYKRDHPNVKAVSAVGKAGGEKWKSMSKAEKAPYEVKAAKRKTEYETLMTAYNKKQDSSIADEKEEESDKSKSDVNDDDEDDDEDDD